MNYYIISFRLDSDKRSDKRLWENFAESKEFAISELCNYIKCNLNDLFTNVIILSINEYKSVFK